MTAQKRVAILGFMLESNGFAPPTTEADFRKRCYFEGDGILHELAVPNSRLPKEIDGFVGQMNALGIDWRAMPIVVTDAEPGGPVEQVFFERPLSEMEKRLRDAMPDSVFDELLRVLAHERSPGQAEPRADDRVHSRRTYRRCLCACQAQPEHR